MSRATEKPGSIAISASVNAISSAHAREARSPGEIGIVRRGERKIREIRSLIKSEGKPYYCKL